MSYLVKRPTETAEWFLPGILFGMWFTLKKMIYNIFHQKKMETLNYPEQKYEYGPRFKGNHVLTVKKDGSIRCTACMLCATNCPAQCIKIHAAESTDPTVEKFPISYEIDVLRCVYCGFCEEACPVDAIRMGLNGKPRRSMAQNLPTIFSNSPTAPNLKAESSVCSTIRSAITPAFDSRGCISAICRVRQIARVGGSKMH